MNLNLAFVVQRVSALINVFVDDAYCLQLIDRYEVAACFSEFRLRFMSNLVILVCSKKYLF